MFVVPKRLQTAPASYALSVVLAGVAALLQWLIHPWVGSRVSDMFFLIALIFTVVALGRGPALVVLSAAVLNALLIAAPEGQLSIGHPHDLAAIWLFIGVGLLLVAYGNRLKLTTARAALAEERLALAQRNTSVGIFELDFEANTAFVSPSLCGILGRPVVEGNVTLERWFAGMRAADVEDSLRSMKSRIARGELLYEREQRIELPNGEGRWLLNRVELEATPDGVLKRARGATVDISARKRVDELLQQAQEHLRQQLKDQGRLHAFGQKLVAAGDDLPAALQGLLDIMVDLYGTDHGVVSLLSEDYRTVSVAAAAGFREEVLASVAAVADTGVPADAAQRSLALEHAAYESLLATHRDLCAAADLQGLQSVPLLGAQAEVLGAISVMFTQAHEQSEREKHLGDVCATTASAVVARERARAAAARNEKRFSVALESSGVPFSILAPLRDDDGRIVDFEWTYMNPAAARAVGKDPQVLIGNAVGSVLPRAWEPSGLFERYVKVVERSEQSQFELQTSATDQGSRWYSIVAAPLQGSVAVWFADITQRKLHEQSLEDADRRKDEFLATLAHELRNPLAPIRQAVRVAGAGNASDAQKRWSHGIIERQVQHMSVLLDDLLDVSRIGRGTLLLRKSREPLAAIVDTAIETARPHIEAKQHQLAVYLPTVPVILEIDPVRIAQVLSNLLTNAAKYTDPGGHIRLLARLEAPDFIISVKDDGIGLTPEQQTDVFKMFSQVSADEDRSQGGLGIGLALARGLVELHGGALEAASEGLGHGTEFSIRLPNTCIVEADDASTSNPAGETGDKGSNNCILIADDNVDAADSLAELLRLEGHEVHVAYDGAQALATFARVKPDAALLDVAMPRVSGLDVVRAIRQGPCGERATLIAVTGWGQEEDRQLALEAGFDHYMTKPMRPEDIGQLLVRGRSVRGLKSV